MTAAMPRTAPLAARRASGRAPRRSLRARASLSNGGGHKSTIHRIIAENNGIVVVPGARPAPSPPAGPHWRRPRRAAPPSRPAHAPPTPPDTAAGCYDALSALCLAQAGHKAGFVSGAAVSAALLGAPDIGVLTPPEMAARTAQIAAAAPGLPVIVDADSGGGSPLNVQRTVRELLAAGAKGCVLEDQRWPKRLGYMRTKEIVSPEAMVAKLLAAREVIGDADFFLVARTDARSTSARRGLDDAVARANLYVVSRAARLPAPWASARSAGGARAAGARPRCPAPPAAAPAFEPSPQPPLRPPPRRTRARTRTSSAASAPRTSSPPSARARRGCASPTWSRAA